MVVAFVQAVVDTDNATNAADVLTTITIGSGANRCLVVGVAHRGALTAVTATSDVDGAFTTADTVSSQADNFGRASTVLYLLNPTAGDHTVTIDGTGGVVKGVYTQIELTGVDQVSPIASTDSDAATTGTTSSSTPATANDDDLIVDCLSIRQTTAPTIGADQTSRSSVIIDTAINLWGATSTQPGSVSGDVMSWTHDDVQHGHVAVAFASSGRIMGSIAGQGGLAGAGGIAGRGGGLAA